MKIANEHSFARLLSTDAIREIMRVQDTTENLHYIVLPFKGDSVMLYSIGKTPAKRLKAGFNTIEET